MSNSLTCNVKNVAWTWKFFVAVATESRVLLLQTLRIFWSVFRYPHWQIFLFLSSALFWHPHKIFGSFCIGAPYPDCFCWHTVLAVRADSVCYASKIWLSHAPHTHRRTFISFSIWCCSQHSPGCPCIFISHCLSCLPLSSISLTQN